MVRQALYGDDYLLHSRLTGLSNDVGENPDQGHDSNPGTPTFNGMRPSVNRLF